MKVLQPPSWPRPQGYSPGIEAKGSLIFVSGQIAFNDEGQLIAGDLVAQVRRSLENVMSVLKQAGARSEHIARMTWYVKDKHEYLRLAPAIGKAYRELMGSHYPAMSLVQVADLLEDGALVEIECTAVLPSER